MANNLFFHNVHQQIYDYSTNLKGEIEWFSALIDRTWSPRKQICPAKTTSHLLGPAKYKPSAKTNLLSLMQNVHSLKYNGYVVIQHMNGTIILFFIFK